MSPPVLALTQGDPAGIGPEILVRLLARSPAAGLPWIPLVVAERAALEPLAALVPGAPWDRLRYLAAVPSRAEIERAAAVGAIAVLDPVGRRRSLTWGASGPDDAAGALAALDAGADLARRGEVDALVTAPLAKGPIARHVLPGFVGHTDYLAQAAGLTRYGRDYLMAFLSPGLQVALLTTHVPLAAAVAAVRRETVEEALACLGRHAAGRIAVAALDPHAGEGGLLGDTDDRELVPAVAAARSAGLDVHGPESADSLFARASRGEFDWVLALYHDQGLIAVKTAAFGLATNWTLGLPYLRTSVDHGTAFSLAGTGRAEVEPLVHVVETTLAMILGELPRGGRGVQPRRPAW